MPAQSGRSDINAGSSLGSTKGGDHPKASEHPHARKSKNKGNESAENSGNLTPPTAGGEEPGEGNESAAQDISYFCEACGQGFEKPGNCPDCNKPLVKAPTEDPDALEGDPGEVTPDGEVASLSQEENPENSTPSVNLE